MNETRNTINSVSTFYHKSLSPSAEVSPFVNISSIFFLNICFSKQIADQTHFEVIKVYRSAKRGVKKMKEIKPDGSIMIPISSNKITKSHLLLKDPLSHPPVPPINPELSQIKKGSRNSKRAQKQPNDSETPPYRGLKSQIAIPDSSHRCH